MDVYELPFGIEAGPAAPNIGHVQGEPVRRGPSPGPPGAGDVRSGRGGPMAVLADAVAGGGPDAVVNATGAAVSPGDIGGDIGTAGVAPNLGTGAPGVHFSSQGAGAQATSGFGAAPGSTSAAPGGFAPTSGPGPAQEGSRSLVGTSYSTPLNPGLVNQSPVNPFSGSAPAKAI